MSLKDSPIVILDEPYAGVDIDSRDKIKEVIKILFKDKTVIVISHDEGEEEYDRVLELCSLV